MRIAIDGNEANVEKRVGSNVYAWQILRRLYQLTESAHYQVTVLLRSPTLPDMPKSRTNWQYQVLQPSRFWTQWALPLHLKQEKNRYDVFFTPGHYGPSFCPLPMVTSVMDLAFIDYPKLFRLSDFLQLSVWTRSSVRRADAVVTISQFSKQQISKHYAKPAGQILVAPPSLPQISRRPSKKEMLSRLKKWKIREPYFLHIGTLQPRKNLNILIEAYSHLRTNLKTDEKPQLVLAGKIGWLADDLLKKIARSDFKHDIILTGFVSETEKNILLFGSLASVQIGLLEGFGIPILEAMSAGTISIAANTSSLPEAVGGAGILVNPTDSKAITDALHKVLTLKPKERAVLRKAGREQLKQFNWTKSAQKILKLLEHLGERP